MIVTGPFLPPPPGPAGAVERVWHGLATEFARAGHRVTFLCRETPGRPADETVDGVRFVRRTCLTRARRMAVSLIKDLGYSWRMAGLVPRNADVVVTNAFWLPAVLPLHRRGHAVIAPNLQRMPKGQLRLYARADRFLAVSEAVREAVAAERPDLADRVRVVPNPIDTTAFRPGPTGPPGRVPRVLFAGRVHPEKGIQVLVEAALRLGGGRRFEIEVIGPWTLAEGGGGPEFRRRLQEQAAGLPVAWRDPVYDRAALADVYRSADVFCYPSLADRGETFGVAPLEAMACGVPAVVSDLACFRDYLSPGVNGLVFDHRSADPAAALAEQLARLLDDPAARGRMGRAAAETAARYSYPAVAARYLNEFESWVA